MKKFNAVKLVGLVGLALGGVATLIGNWAQEKQMEEKKKKKVNEALAERNREESE